MGMSRIFKTVDYEQALCPELILHTDVQGLQGALEEVLRLAHRLQPVVTSKNAQSTCR